MSAQQPEASATHTSLEQNDVYRRVRVFRFQSGKLRRTYDESLTAANELQRGESELYNLEPIDFGRRMAGEKDLIADPEAPQPNAIFDESGNFIIYATLLGIKVCELLPHDDSAPSNALVFIHYVIFFESSHVATDILWPQPVAVRCPIGGANHT